MLIIPLFAFVVAIILTRSSWRLALILLFLCPLLASTVLMVGEASVSAITREVSLSSFREFGEFAFLFYVITFPLTLYPPAAWLGAATLPAWAGCRRWFSSRDFSPGGRLVFGAVLGTLIGGLFAVLMIVSYNSQQFSARFGSVISLREAADRFPPSILPEISIILGLVDGLLLALTASNSGSEEKAEKRTA
jgi:hypothetical protein